MSNTFYQGENGPHVLALTQYYGGVEKGVCVQITGLNCDNETGYVGMTRKEAKDIAEQLEGWLQA